VTCRRLALLPGLALAALVAAVVTLWPARAQADAAAPAGHEETAFDFMNLLAQRGLHDLANERWNAYGQLTYITSFKLPFRVPYTNVNGSTNSLTGDYERGFTFTASLYLGVKLWPGGELYFAPELVSQKAFSQLRGLGGAIENFELQKLGTVTPTGYHSRLFLRQTFNFGGAKVLKDSDPLQLGKTVTSRRLVVTAGNLAVVDIFSKNSVLSDPRQTFLNLAFATFPSYDFVADARGFTYGVAAELYWDAWVVRAGHFLPPVHPNEQSIDFHFWDRYGDSFELEHAHQIRRLAGAVRLLYYRNHVYSGRFDEAIAAYHADPGKNAASCPSSVYHFGSGNFTAPDLCWVRRANSKWGVGVNVEQFVARDVGVFVRGMYSDGQSEVDAFNAADRDLSFGAVARGTWWKRPFDVTGIGVSLSWISGIHARYLALGGIDNFIGDGRLGRVAEEGLFEVFYSFNLFKAIWLSLDYQLIWNPGYNAERAGPVHIPGVRAHAEF
jgi:hypothetical protein